MLRALALALLLSAVGCGYHGLCNHLTECVPCCTAGYICQAEGCVPDPELADMGAPADMSTPPSDG